MAASSGSPPQRPREPAWKRIGLKLKSSGSRSHELAKSAVTSETSTAGSRSKQTTNDIPSPSKKRKTFDDSAIDSQDPVANVVRASDVHQEPQPSLNQVNHGLRAASTTQEPNDEVESTSDTQDKHEEVPEPDLALKTGERPRRKSVTFSADTKQDDEGSDSVHERSADQAIHSDQSTKLSSVSNEAEKQEIHGGDLTAPAASSKKPRKKRKGNQTPSEHTPEYLNYLKTFHTDRASWKFNKNNQKGLLRDLFRVDLIPTEYNEALLNYISGLQGAAARQRIVERATSVLKEIAEKDGDFQLDTDMESEEARRDAYTAALHRHLEKYGRAGLRRDEYDDLQLEDMQRDAERGTRAEAVLRVALEEYLYPTNTLVAPESSQISTTMREDTASQAASTATTTPTSKSNGASKRKRRKARTQASSDDESSSENETSESEGDYNPKRGPATVQDALRVRTSPPSKYLRQDANPRKKIFDDEFLDQIFPKKQTYHDTAPKRRTGHSAKPRGFAYTHGTRADESESE